MSLNSQDYFRRDCFSEWLGVELKEARSDYACCALVVAPNHHNGLGGVHGAVIFSLADIAFASACNTGDRQAVGLQAEIRYIQKVHGKRLLAEASLVGETQKLSHYQVRITDCSAETLALFTGTAYKFPVSAKGQ